METDEMRSHHIEFGLGVVRTVCFTVLLMGLPLSAMGADLRGRVEGQNRFSAVPFPIRGARVDLMDSRGRSVIATSYAGQDGLYYFPNVRSGNYIVRVNGKYFPIVVRATPKQDLAPVRVAS